MRRTTVLCLTPSVCLLSALAATLLLHPATGEENGKESGTRLASFVSGPCGADNAKCPAEHCAQNQAAIAASCEVNNWGADVDICIDRGPIGRSPTDCRCSCSGLMAFDTPVAIADGKTKPIHTIREGEEVLVVAERDGTRVWIPQKVEHSRGSSPDTTTAGGTAARAREMEHDYIIEVQFGDKILYANPEHLFLTVDRSGKEALTRADRLITNRHRFLSLEFAPVDIRSVVSGRFEKKLWHVSTAHSDSSRNSHLIATAGIISGDYFLQQRHADAPELKTDPQVGSPEYLAATARGDSFAPNVKLRDAAFRPADSLPRPQGAKTFVSKSRETAKAEMLRPLDDQNTLQKVRQIEALFVGFFGNDITFELDWSSNVANAEAFLVDGRRHVKVYGGVARNRKIGPEGLALVYAHEVAHHFNLPNAARYPNGDWAYCEGWADYAAALAHMRRVYPDAEYIDVMQPAVDQIYDFLTFGLTGPEPPSTGTCDHPPAECRRDTYHAAMRAEAIPDCATP